MSFDAALEAAVAGDALTERQARAAFDAVLAGDVPEVRVAALLTAMRVRGETPAEIAGAAAAMRAAMVPVAAPEGTLDTCGTGGTGLHTLNVSTASAIVLASLGVPVAKHGNRAASSLSGSSDVLAALGVGLVRPARAEAVLARLGLAFLYAPYHHPGLAPIAPLRRALGFRTVFNVLGPLCSPARARLQVLGVSQDALRRPLAEALAAVGTARAWVVHGADGLDELTVCGDSRVTVLEDGALTERTVTPEEAGLTRRPEGALRGGDPDHNADALRAVLDGHPGAYRDAVALNAAAGLVVVRRAAGLAEGARLAEAAMDDGRARSLLDRLVTETNA